MPNNQHIIITSIGPHIGRLECQGADLAYILDEASQAELLAKNQAEMQAFADFLVKTPSV